MKHMRYLTLASCAFGVAVSVNAVEKPLLAIPGKVIYENKLDAAPAAPWKAAKGSWELVDGAWRGSEKPEDQHGAVTRLPNKLPDCVIEYEFRFEGGKSTGLSINAIKEHMARIMITPQWVSVQRDGSHDGAQKPVVFARFAVNFTTGVWHKVRMEMVGDTILGQVDELIAWGRDDLFKQDRMVPGFTVGGQSVDFRNLSIREAALNPDWDGVRAALPKPGEKIAPLPARLGAAKAGAKALPKTE